MAVVIGIQRKMMELGRVRLGDEKISANKPGRPRSSFRFTSASRRLLEHVASAYGGECVPWENAPKGEGYWQVSTDASELNIILPPTFSEADGSPTTSYSQYYELWTRGGCQRRCDGLTEALTGKPCLCDPERRKAGEETECKIHTRVSFMLPEIPGLGVWRLETSGYWAAVELPGTLDVLARAAAEMEFIRAVLRIEHRKDVKAGQTRKFIVPVIELPDVTIGQLVSGTAPTLALNAPAAPAEKPALPAAPPPPAENGFDNGSPGFGAPPPLPTVAESSDPVISEAQRKRLRAIQTRCGVSDDDLRAMVAELCGVDSSKLIPLRTYDALVAALEAAAETEFRIPAGAQTGEAS